MGVELVDNSPKRALQDSSVFESEKIGVAVLGRRFADKMEHLPLKKRRLLVQRLSPPPRAPSPDREECLTSQSQNPSPHLEESEQLVDSKCASGQKADFNWKIGALDGYVAVKSSDGAELGFSEDFSGIALLAVVACSSSVDDDDRNVEKVEKFAATRVEASTAAIPIKETMASSERVRFLQQDSVTVDNTDGSLVQDNSVFLSHNLHKNKNGGPMGRPVPSKDDRLHWDLNTVMDEWEKPCDVNSQINYSGSVRDDGMQSGKLTSEVCKVQRDFEDTRCDIESKVQSVSCGIISSDPHGSQMLIDPKGMLLRTNKPNLEEHILQVCSAPFYIEKKCVTTPTEHVLEPLNRAVAETKSPAPVISTKASLHNCGCPGSNHIASTCFGEKINTSASMVVQYGNDFSRTSATIHGKSSLESVPAGKLDVVSTDMLILDTPACYTDSLKSKDGEESAVDTTVKDFQLHSELKELMPKCYGHRISSKETHGGTISQESCRSYGDDPTNCSGKLTSVDPFSECNGSDVSQDERGHRVSMENMRELQEGYDSPFEEGELREPVVYSWEDNEVEHGETGPMDKGSVDRDYFDALDYSMSKNLAIEREGCQMSEKGSSLVKKDETEKSGMGGKSVSDAGSDKAVEQCVKRDTLMKLSHSASLKTKASGGNQFQEHQGDVNAEGNNDGLDDKGLVAGEFGARASRQKLSSHIEGPFFDLIHRKNAVFIERRRSDNLRYSYSRAEKDFGSDKSLGRDGFSFPARGRNEADGHRIDSSVAYWDSRNRYPHSYRGSKGQDYSRPRDLIANSADKGTGLNCHDDRRSVNYSSKGMYRPFIRRRSPAGRDDSYGSRRGTPPSRGIGHDRSQSRPGIYAQRVRRGPKEEYHEPLPDNVGASSIRMPNYFSRREHGLSPNISRGAHVSRPHRKSRSRSPLAWHLQRDQRSPTRMFRRGQRFDSVGFSGRFKSDDNLRPFTHREKYSQMAGTGRGRKIEDSDDDRRKHDDRYEMSRRVRRYDAGGTLRRFRYDTEDWFEAHNSRNVDDCSRGTLRRDVPRSSREERSPSKYNSDRIYACASSSGQRDLEENAAPTEE